MRNITRIIVAIACLFILMNGVGSAQEKDAKGGKDHPLFNRMPGFYIQRYEEKSFETHPFWTASDKEVQVEGRFFEIHYSLQPKAKEPSRVEILRNYENAITRIGGSALFRNDDGSSYLKLVKDGKEIWVHVSAYITNEYTVFVVEKQGMAQNIVANAAVFAEGIRTTGHAAVYGIYFDTGKSVIKPDSDAALVEIAKLLSGDPDLKVHVVGHTDNVGAMDSNMKLSQARAEAVVQALITRHKIAAARLKAYAVGPLAPVATNDSEEGKAKNRRVELVKQ
jgi:OOP family OmpA-OmpF porin